MFAYLDVDTTMTVQVNELVSMGSVLTHAYHKLHLVEQMPCVEYLNIDQCVCVLMDLEENQVELAHNSSVRMTQIASQTKGVWKENARILVWCQAHADLMHNVELLINWHNVHAHLDITATLQLNASKVTKK